MAIVNPAANTFAASDRAEPEAVEYPGERASWLQVAPLVVVLLMFFGLPMLVVLAVSFFDFSRTEIKPLRDGKTEPVSKTVEIKSLAGPEHVFKVTKVDKQTDSFETRLETVTEGKHYRLVVLLSKLPDVSTRTLREKIVIHTDDPSLKEIPINAIAALQ